MLTNYYIFDHSGCQCLKFCYLNLALRGFECGCIVNQEFENITASKLVPMATASPLLWDAIKMFAISCVCAGPTFCTRSRSRVSHIGLFWNLGRKFDDQVWGNGNRKRLWPEDRPQSVSWRWCLNWHYPYQLWQWNIKCVGSSTLPIMRSATARLSRK